MNKGTFNLPNFQDRVIQGSGSRGVVGTYKAESLPNITGTIPNVWKVNETPTGAFFIEGSGIANAPSLGSSASKNIKMDASRSSSTYQNSAPVQPNALLIQCCIKY